MSMPWQTPQEMYLAIALVLAVTAAAALLGLFFWQRHRGRRLSERIDRLTTAMTLLTDTVESSLHDVVRELSRLGPVAAIPAPTATAPAAAVAPEARVRTKHATQRRIRGAARRGRSLADIAAAERLSEGEVRLMMQMSPGGGASGGAEPAQAAGR